MIVMGNFNIKMAAGCQIGYGTDLERIMIRERNLKRTKTGQGGNGQWIGTQREETISEWKIVDGVERK